MTTPTPERVGGDIGTIKTLVREQDAYEAYITNLRVLMSAMALMLMDEKGKVRINKQILNKVNSGKIEDITWDTNTAGAVIMQVVTAGEAPKPKKAKK
jgi:hypothetical protein